MIEKFEARRITIRVDQALWLDEHPEISLSGLTQRAIDTLNINFVAEIDDADKDIIKSIFERLESPESYIKLETIKTNLSANHSSIDLNELKDRLEIMEKRTRYLETEGTPIHSARLTAEGRQYWKKNRFIK